MSDLIYEYAFDLASLRIKYGCDTEKNIQIIKECIEYGIDISRQNSKLLINAIETGNIDIVNFLMDNRINFRVNSDEPLVKACKSGCLEIIKILLVNGADATTSNNLPIETITKFYCRPSEGIVELLVEYGANPFINCNKLLSKACRYFNFPLVSYLISIGANYKEITDNPILNIFNSAGNTELKRLLLENGADPNSSDSERLLEKAFYRYSIEDCKLLLEFGANPKLCQSIYDHIDASDVHIELLDLFVL